jgi:hypothetical protein
MAIKYHVVVKATDFLGHVTRLEMTVIAADERELRDEIASFFCLRDVTDCWEILEFLERQPLSDSDPHSIAYRNQGPHSYS